MWHAHATKPIQEIKNRSRASALGRTTLITLTEGRPYNIHFDRQIGYEDMYATHLDPFAVSISGDVKVTYINGIESQNENTVYLTEQEITGVIPANTPVILYTERGGWNSELWSETEE